MTQDFNSLNAKKEHNHPFPPFVSDKTKILILGTFPGKKYTAPCVKSGSEDWYYGNPRNKFWELIAYSLDYPINLLNTKKQKQEILAEHNIGITDIIQCAYRRADKNSDDNLEVLKVRNLNHILKKYPNITTLLLTSKDMYARFFKPYYVKKGNEPFFIEKEKLEKEYQGLKINIYYYHFIGRTIRVIPVHSPARDTISFNKKKEIYKAVINEGLTKH